MGHKNIRDACIAILYTFSMFKHGLTVTMCTCCLDRGLNLYHCCFVGDSVLNGEVIYSHNYPHYRFQL